MFFFGFKTDITERLFNRLVFGAVAIGLLALAIAALAVVGSIAAEQGFNERVDHTFRVKSAIETYRTLMERSEAARRGYLIDPRGGYAAVFADTLDVKAPAVRKIADLVQDNPRQQANVKQLLPLAEAHRQAMIASVAAVKGGRTEPGVALFKSEDNLRQVTAIRALLFAMLAEEDRLLAKRSAEQAAGTQRLYVTLIVAGLVVLVVAVGSSVAIVRYTQDLATSRGALRNLNASLEATVEDRTQDLRRANDEIQRFAYIVSHDLRSPLVNIMGFTSELEAAAKPLGGFVAAVEKARPELVTKEAREAVELDLPEAVRFIRSATEKMDRLINAILRLSREGRRVLTPEPLDMTALVRGIADSLSHRTGELGAEIAVEPLPGIVADRVAVEQVLSNLVENAVKYLKPGRPGRIVVRGRREGLRAIYEVQDNGRGIDPKDHERIFDLFRRSGMQDQPGEGIGLAHVRALAYRLGGVISVQSALDQGSTFSLSLPASQSGEAI